MQNIPDDLRIPTPPQGRWMPSARRRISAWQEAAGAGLVGLIAAWTAAELALLLNGF